MTCEDCENKVPDRTVDNNCSDGINDAILGKISDAAVGPVSTGAGNRGGLTADAASPISYISNAVRNISKRFGKVQPGIYMTDEQAQSMNTDVSVIFDDLEENLSKLVVRIEKRTQDINNQVVDKYTEVLKNSNGNNSNGNNSNGNNSNGNNSSNCENLFDGFDIEIPFGMDWVNPIGFSTLLKFGTCRLDLGCGFCDFPGDINIPPFPGIPSCNFLVEDDICGVGFLNPFATIQNVVNGFQLFVQQVGQFAYGFFDLLNLATGFLGRCIMRILNCLSKFFADMTLDLGLNTFGAKIRETISTTTAIVTGALAKLNIIFITIQEIIKSAVLELFRFINDILSLCDPCKLVQAIANPATLPEIPTFGGLLD